MAHLREGSRVTVTISIACIGWYGKQNWGDEILRNALIALLRNHETVFFGYMPKVSMLNQFDYLIVGGGSIFPHHPFFAHYKRIRKELRTPFSVAGISAKAQPDQVIVSQIIEDARHFIVRDYHTFTQLGCNPKVAVAPDLSWLVPIAAAEREVHEPIAGLNLRDGQGVSPNSLRGIVEVLRLHTSNIVPQSFFYGPPIWERTETDEAIMGRFNLFSFGNTPIEAYYNVKFVVAMRFHALVLSTQAGIPFIGFDYHPKTRAFCKEMGLHQFCVPIDDMARFETALIQLASQYDELREHLRTKRTEHIEQAQAKYGLIQMDIAALATRKTKSLGPRLRSLLRRLT
jgi:polysaccharide pyruvyl transferase WcaK-like protein